MDSPILLVYAAEWFEMDNPGLRAKLVPASVVERSKTGVQIAERHDWEIESDKDGGRQVDRSVATWHVLSQRERGLVSRRDSG